MPVKEVLTYELSCDNCDYVAETDECEITLFDSSEAAVKYAESAGWQHAQVDNIHWFACNGCGEQ